MKDGTDRKQHWDRVYEATQSTVGSWYQREPTRSLEILAEADAGPERTIIDVGGGDSTLVDAVLERHLGRMTVLDLSGAALARARARLGPRAKDVTWIEADVTGVELPPCGYDVWHDRAVFHFLTDSGDRERYVAAAARALKRSGTLIVATFGPEGPTRCSGLAVTRYRPEELAREFGDAFELLRGFEDVHRTPSGAEQQFTFAIFRRA